MPLEQRVVEPICISRGTLPLDAQGSLAIPIPNELECVTNGSLANVIRELSSLSRYAEDVFGGIVTEMGRMITRSTGLQGRIDRLGIQVTQLDSSVEEVSIHDLHLKKPFKSSSSYDQQVVSRSTIPSSLLDQYKLCDKPPPLSKLNVYRDDKKDGLKFYTDPGYFFELWRQEMLQMSEREAIRAANKKPGHRGSSSSTKTPPNGSIKDAGHHSMTNNHAAAALTATTNRSKKPRQPANTRERYQMQAAQQEFLPGVNASSNSHPSSSNHLLQQQQQQQHHSQQQNGGIYTTAGAYGTLQRPNSLEISQYINENPYLVHQMQQQKQQHPLHPDQFQGQSYPYGNNNIQQQHQQMDYMNNKVNHQGDYAAQMTQNTPPVSLQQQHQQHTPPQNQSTPNRKSGSTPGSRPSQPPPAPPSNASSNSSSGQGTPTGTPSRGSRGNSVPRDVLPPPPPPPMPEYPLTGHQGILGVVNGDFSEQSLPPPPSSQASKTNGQQSLQMQQMIPDANNVHNNNMSHNRQLNASQVSAPPPPPPLPSDLGIEGNSSQSTNNSSLPPSFAQQIQAKHSQLQPPKVSTANRVLPQHLMAQSTDTRSSLLAAIREGIKLRRVEDHKQKEVERSAPCNDVASILARRVPQELSDSDSEEDGGGGGNNSGFESDAWDDS